MLHLVGHSLGAQAAGVAGNTARIRPGRITGLDPALPLFQTLPLTLRLDRSDADFVDIIHTDSGGFGNKIHQHIVLDFGIWRRSLLIGISSYF